MPGETILVVDDAPLNLKLTDILLRKEGYRVVTASDAEQALAILNSLHPDLILIDIQLPGMDGLELSRRLKRNSRTRDIVLVALTACAMKGDDLRAYDAGCDGYITKPVDTARLAAQIRDYLAQRPAATSARVATAQDCGGT
ncbi:MAG TPA: response regulator [Bryobacteraceae bacterium]|jgi:CheY-like chemotaxis protein|nr:response regulator [Bryobacteraceae bacterium]